MLGGGGMLNSAIQETQKTILQNAVCFKDCLVVCANLLKQYPLPTFVQFANYTNDCFKNQVVQAYRRYRDNNRDDITQPHGLDKLFKDNPRLDYRLIVSLYEQKQNTNALTLEKEVIDSILSEFKTLYKIFKSGVFQVYLEQENHQMHLPLQLATLIEWMDYGLNNITTFVLDAGNSTLSWLSQNTVKDEKSYWDRFVSYFSQAAINYFALSNKFVGMIFDFEGYFKAMEAVCNQVDVFFYQYKPIPQQLNGSQSSSQNAFDSLNEICSIFSSGSISFDRILRQNILNDKKSIDFEMSGELYRQTLNNIIQQKILVEFKILVEQIQYLNVLNEFKTNLNSEIDTLLYLSGQWEQDNETFCFSIDDIINQAQQKINLLIHILSNSPHQATQLLLTILSKQIDSYKFKSFHLPYSKEYAGLESSAKSIYQNKLLFDLTKYAKRRQRITSNMTNANILPAETMPEFENLVPFENMSSSSGAQEKLLGSGFYQNTVDGHKYYVKGTTNINHIADDICEVLASRICAAVGASSLFAECAYVKSKNTNTIYIRSRVADRFKSIYDMSSRSINFTTRLTPNERSELLSNLKKKQAPILRKILYVCLILGDYDPNPSNIGYSNVGLLKIDHGWSFDQVCDNELNLWDDLLNPFRHVGRLAPTNSICDYAELFKEIDLDVIKRLRIAFSANNIKPVILSFLYDSVNIYQGTKAYGCLKDTITPSDVVKMYCERIGIPYQSDIELSLIADVLSRSLKHRAMNVELACILHYLAFNEATDENLEQLSENIEQLSCHGALLINQQKIKNLFEQATLNNQEHDNVLKKLYSKVDSISKPSTKSEETTSLDELNGTSDDDVSPTHVMFTKTLNNKNAENESDSNNQNKSKKRKFNLIDSDETKEEFRRPTKRPKTRHKK